MPHDPEREFGPDDPAPKRAPFPQAWWDLPLRSRRLVALGVAATVSVVLVIGVQWIVGTPEDCIAGINRLQEQSGGFGGFLVQTIDWAPREKMLRSYELMARYVMPQFQGTVASTFASNQWAAERKETLVAGRVRAMDRAKQVYADRRS